MKFIEALRAWLEAEENLDNPFYEIVKVLAGIVEFIASL